MRKGFIAILLAGALAVAGGMTAPAFARGGGGGHGGGAFGTAGPSFSSTGLPPGFSSGGRRTGWHGATTPPGWSSRGKRTGWNGGTMPPGLARHAH